MRTQILKIGKDEGTIGEFDISTCEVTLTKDRNDADDPGVP